MKNLKEYGDELFFFKSHTNNFEVFQRLNMNITALNQENVEQAYKDTWRLMLMYIAHHDTISYYALDCLKELVNVLAENELQKNIMIMDFSNLFVSEYSKQIQDELL